MRLIKLMPIAAFIMLAFYSCDPSLIGHDWGNQSEESGRKLVIRLTDEPIDAEEVNIDIQGIMIKTNEGFDSVALETAKGIYNLLDYQDGVDTLIGNAIIDFEGIKEIRLILGDENSIKVDGELFPLIIPSGSQTGLKIKVNIDVTNEELIEILIDFDALKSIVKHGNGEYHLKPVIKVKKIIKDGEEEDLENEDEDDDSDSDDDDDDSDNDDDDSDDENEGDVECTKGKGYWKTHSLEGPAALDSAWLEIEDPSDLFGTGVSYYSFLASSAGNDVYAKLAQQYIIAELNVLAGVEIPGEALDAWNQAGELLLLYAEDKKISDADEALAKSLKELLSEFNSGELGPISCDDDDDSDEDDSDDDSDDDDDNDDNDDDDDDDDDDELTEGMINTINELYPGADASSPKDSELCDGTKVVELKINFESDNIFLIFDESGETFLSLYVKGDEDDLPSNIIEKLDTDFDGYKIKKVYLWTSVNGAPSFEVEIQKGSSKKTLIFNDGAEIICD